MRLLAACAGLVLLALPLTARADDDADLKATAFFKSCDAANYAEIQCLCIAKSLSLGGRQIDPTLLVAMEEDFTLAGKGELTLPSVTTALSHRTPPMHATDSEISAAIVVLARATHHCSHVR